MYEKLKNCLIFPKKIGQYIGEKKIKTFGFFCFLTLLLLIPSFVSIMVTNSIDSTYVAPIRTEFEQKTIHYAIEDGRLIANTTRTEFVEKVYTVEDYDLSIVCVFTDSLSNANIVNELSSDISYLIVFNPEDIRVCFGTKVLGYDNDDSTALSNMTLLSTQTSQEGMMLAFFSISYDELDNASINFEDLSNITVFEEKFQNFADKLFTAVKNSLLGFLIPTLIIASALELLFSCLFIAILLKIFFRVRSLKFGTFFQAAILCSLPYVLIEVIALLTHFEYLTLIGDLLVVSYTFKALFEYISMNKENHQDIVNEVRIMPGVYIHKEEPTETTNNDSVIDAEVDQVEDDSSNENEEK